MLKNLLVTPVIKGRISMGRLVQVGNTLQPEPADEFFITTNSQCNGQWQEHPIASTLKQTADQKIKSIPVRVIFDKVENNFQATYSSFSAAGRCICTSKDGVQAKRLDKKVGFITTDCQSPDFCDFAKEHGCKQYARLNIAMDSDFDKDPYISFILRTTGYNSIAALTYRLNQYHALTNGKMAGMRLNLVIREKTASILSKNQIYFVDLEPRENIKYAVMSAYEHHKYAEDIGINIAAMEDFLATGLHQAPQIEAVVDQEIISQEFFSKDDGNSGNSVVSKGIYDLITVDESTWVPSMEYNAVSEKIGKSDPSDQSVANSLRSWITSNRTMSPFEQEKALQLIDVTFSVAVEPT